MWRDGARGLVEKRSGEEKFLVSRKTNGEKDVKIFGPEHRIDKRFRATEALWDPGATRYEEDLDQHRFEEAKWKDMVMTFIGIDLSRKQQYQDQQQEQEQVFDVNYQTVRIL